MVTFLMVFGLFRRLDHAFLTFPSPYVHFFVHICSFFGGVYWEKHGWNHALMIPKTVQTGWMIPSLTKIPRFRYNLTLLFFNCTHCNVHTTLASNIVILRNRAQSYISRSISYLVFSHTYRCLKSNLPPRPPCLQ
jgi:hypothetical protein